MAIRMLIAASFVPASPPLAVFPCAIDTVALKANAIAVQHIRLLPMNFIILTPQLGIRHDTTKTLVWPRMPWSTPLHHHRL
jgi:hypothetical protein